MFRTKSLLLLASISGLFSIGTGLALPSGSDIVPSEGVLLTEVSNNTAIPWFNSLSLSIDSSIIQARGIPSCSLRGLHTGNDEIGTDITSRMTNIRPFNQADPTAGHTFVNIPGSPTLQFIAFSSMGSPIIGHVLIRNNGERRRTFEVMQYNAGRLICVWPETHVDPQQTYDAAAFEWRSNGNYFIRFLD